MIEKINWKIFNASLWIEVILCYFLPYKVVDKFNNSVGFPIPFLTVGNHGTLDISPFSSMGIDPFLFILNGGIIYLIITIGIKICCRLNKIFEI